MSHKDLYIVKTKKGWKIVKDLAKEMKKKKLPAGVEELPCMCHFSKKDQKMIKGMGLEDTSNSGDCAISDSESESEDESEKPRGAGLGGALSQKDLKGLLGASYDPTDNVNDFQLDKESSSKTSQVYHNPKTGQTVVAHRGTSGVLDWGNNLVYAVAGKKGYKMTPRYKEAEKVQKKAQEKYGAKNVSTIGHSQGGLQAELLGKDSKEIITLNKATRPFENKAEANQTDIRTSGDVVSALNPFQKKNKKEKVIQSKTSNPLTEHSLDTVEETDEMVGEGFDKIKWGTFTKQFKKFKKLHPNATMEQFAKDVINHPEKYQKITEKRARFYMNIILRKK
jgi:hypothetical protein